MDKPKNFACGAPKIQHDLPKVRFQPGGWSVDKPGRWTGGGVCLQSSVTAFSHGLHNADKVVVGEHHLSCLFGHIAACYPQLCRSPYTWRVPPPQRAPPYVVYPAGIPGAGEQLFKRTPLQLPNLKRSLVLWTAYFFVKKIQHNIILLHRAVFREWDFFSRLGPPPPN